MENTAYKNLRIGGTCSS